MHGNGHRPKPAKTTPEADLEPGDPNSSPKDMQTIEKPTESQTAEAERSEAVRQHDRVLYVARQAQDEKMGSDLLGALIVIGALALAGAIAWFLWAYVLSQPAHHAAGPGIILPF